MNKESDYHQLEKVTIKNQLILEKIDGLWKELLEKMTTKMLHIMLYPVFFEKMENFMKNWSMDKAISL